MNEIELLTLALGLGTLAGVNLYLTVLLTGSAIHFNWLNLATEYQSLEVLGTPPVLVVAGALFCIEFFADKIPWVDSTWDSVHTLIRPAGATLIAIGALGDTEPALGVIAALMAGGAAMVTHTSKAGLRFVVNGSPEPVSNVAVSVAEDITVAGLFATLMILVPEHPFIAASIFITILAGLIWIFPRLFRITKASLWLMWNKLRLPGGMAEGTELELPRKVTAEQDILLNTKFGPGSYSVDWAVKCISGKSKRFAGMRANVFGTLVASAEHPEKLVFLSRRRFRTLPIELDLVGCEVTHESKFLSENVVIYDRNDNRTIVFRFTRGQSALAGWLADDLLKRRERAEENDSLAERLSESVVDFPAETKTAATGS